MTENDIRGELGIVIAWEVTPNQSLYLSRCPRIVGASSQRCAGTPGNTVTP